MLISSASVLGARGNLVGGDIGEHHGRADRAAGPGIVEPERTAGGIAGGIKPGDRLIVMVEHAGLGVGLQPAFGAEVAKMDRNRIERGFLQRPQSRVGLAGGIAEGLVVDGAAAPELGVDALGGILVYALHNIDKLWWI